VIDNARVLHCIIRYARNSHQVSSYSDELAFRSYIYIYIPVQFFHPLFVYPNNNPMVYSILVQKKSYFFFFFLDSKSDLFEAKKKRVCHRQSSHNIIQFTHRHKSYTKSLIYRILCIYNILYLYIYSV